MKETLIAILLIIALALLASLILSWNADAASQQQSSTTGTTIITNARAYLNESTASFWTDAEMLVWLNDGVQDIVARTHCTEATASEVLFASTSAYAMGENYVAIKAVIYNDADSTAMGLKRGNPYSMGQESSSWNSSSKPEFWFDWAGSLYVYPTLSSVTTETLTIYYVSRPSDIVASGTIPLPAIYDKALTYYMVAQAYWKDRQTARYGQMMALYENELARYRQDFIEFDVQPEPVIH